MKVVTGNIVKKYKLQKYALTAFGYSKKRTTYPVDLTYRGRKCVSRTEIKKKVTSFFLRDDVSRMTTGRKQTVTRLKTKMQKRLLTSTMRNLHRRFLSIQPGVKACGKVQNIQRRPEMIEHIGEWCVVNYDNEGYPGVIMDVEGHSVKIKRLQRDSINKYFWPGPWEDVSWYHELEDTLPNARTTISELDLFKWIRLFGSMWKISYSNQKMNS
ncbi:hypothetical protein DPX16_0394 [Anabarilius grahami]|uniref:Uncharacterized protein n=1 Tax=Anabarilius grahami TaxID=495550 RepID=A0A3N0Z8A4_ANAGA|nr:hypothetical protein DPX16_0394 [Anabarilius grahami]